MSDGTIYSNQVKTSDTSSKPLNASSPTLNARLNSSGLLQITFGQGESYTIRAVKLEIGTESTLVYDAEPTIGLTDIITDGDINAITSNAVYDSLEHRNLLDNAWFTVNTTGQTSWTVDSSSVEIFDRIRAYGGSLSLSNNQLTLTASASGNGILQRMSGRPFQGIVLTLSVMLSDGNVYSHTVTDGGTEYTVSTNPTIKLSMAYNSSLNMTQTYITTGNGESITVKAMKLEYGSVSTLAHDLPPNYNDELLKCNNPNTLVATEEYGPTSSQAYAIGDYFIRGGKLCKCTQAIASGGTFTKNTNYSEVDVGSQLSNALKTVNGTYTRNTTNVQEVGTNLTIKQCGNVVNISGVLSIALKVTSNPTSLLLGSVSGITLPSSDIYSAPTYMDMGNYKFMQFYISSSGQLWVIMNSQVNGYASVYVNLTYIV